MEVKARNNNEAEEPAAASSEERFKEEAQGGRAEVGWASWGLDAAARLFAASKETEQVRQIGFKGSLHSSEDKTPGLSTKLLLFWPKSAAGAQLLQPTNQPTSSMRSPLFCFTASHSYICISDPFPALFLSINFLSFTEQTL